MEIVEGTSIRMTAYNDSKGILHSTNQKSMIIFEFCQIKFSKPCTLKITGQKSHKRNDKEINLQKTFTQSLNELMEK